MPKSTQSSSVSPVERLWRWVSVTAVLTSPLWVALYARANESTALSVAISGQVASRAEAVSGYAPAIVAPESSSTLEGLGFSVSAVVDDFEPGDDVTVRASGGPPGLTLSVTRVSSARSIATLAGVVSSGTGGMSFNIIWSAVDAGGASSAQSAIQVYVPPQAGDLRASVRQLIRRQYEYGIPAPAVRELGPSALPHLIEVLSDPTSQKYWPNAVAAIGFLGTSSAFEALREFIWETFTGKLDRPTFKAVFRAQAVLGSVAPASPVVLDYLIASLNPSFWADIPWHYRTYSGTELGVLMSGRSIYALSNVPDGRAVQALTQLAETPFDNRQLAYIREALPRQQEVIQKGWVAVLEGTRARAAGGGQ